MDKDTHHIMACTEAARGRGGWGVGSMGSGRGAGAGRRGSVSVWSVGVCVCGARPPAVSLCHCLTVLTYYLNLIQDTETEGVPR